MTRMDEVLDKLAGVKECTTHDLENGFFYVPIEPSSR